MGFLHSAFVPVHVQLRMLDKMFSKSSEESISALPESNQSEAALIRENLIGHSKGLCLARRSL